MAWRRLLLGAFAAYLVGLLGYVVPSHRHEAADDHAQAHQECQLCQVSAQAFLAPEPGICPETPTGPARPVEAVWAPILSLRHSPSASRAPPSV